MWHLFHILCEFISEVWFISLGMNKSVLSVALLAPFFVFTTVKSVLLHHNDKTCCYFTRLSHQTRAFPIPVMGFIALPFIQSPPRSGTGRKLLAPSPQSNASSWFSPCNNSARCRLAACDCVTWSDTAAGGGGHRVFCKRENTIASAADAVRMSCYKCTMRPKHQAGSR